jgi:nitrite reductase (NO-forming)
VRQRAGRARRHLLVAGLVLGYLAAAAAALARATGWPAEPGWRCTWLGAATNAIVLWSEHFAAALLRVPAVGERAGHGQGAGAQW